MGKIKDFPVRRLPARHEGRASVVTSLAKTEDEPFKGFKPLKGLKWLSPLSFLPVPLGAELQWRELLPAFKERSNKPTVQGRLNFSI